MRSYHLKVWALVLIGLSLLAAPALAAPRSYLLQADRSEVGFVFDLAGTAQRGSMPVMQADILIDFERFTRSSVDVTVAVTGAETALPLAAQAMKGESVLDVATYPEIRFQSTAIRPADPRNLSAGGQIDGLMTIRNITHPVTLQAALFRQAGTAEGDLSQLSFRLSGTISRSAFGASGFAAVVADTITLDIAARVIAAR